MTSKARPTIALALIAKNEEKNVKRLLDSVKGCFDEIHLTDTGSTDRTVGIFLEQKAHHPDETQFFVHHFEWVRDFSAARNASYAPIKTDYIMWLDLDDVLHDREAFIKFRDSAMEFADYWLATYHYAVKN